MTTTVQITVGPLISGAEQFVFSPVIVTVRVGDVVHWTWG
jgi:plastocyanin